MLEKYDYVIVGAGLYGAVSARLLQNNGFSCLIIDKRPTIGGNCYTREYNGITIHEYGAHIFHTSNEKVWEFVNKYSRFNQFELKVKATDGENVYTLPFNMATFNEILGVKSTEEAYIMLNGSDNDDSRNLEEYAIKTVGNEVYSKLIKPYTEKQWGCKCSELSRDIIKRLPLRYSYDDNYFNDKYQGLPEKGYTKLIENIINGMNCDGEYFEASIDLLLNTEFDADKWKDSKVIYCGSVDELLGYELGELEYNSLRFEHTIYSYNGHNGQGCPLMNNVNPNVPYTRTVDHIYFDKNKVNDYKGDTILTYEYPIKWEIGKERYYPINNERNSELYSQYIVLLNEKYPNITLGGRMGLYKYLDMDKAIGLAIDTYEKFSKNVEEKEKYNKLSKFCKIWIVGTVDGDVNKKTTSRYGGLYYNKFITKGNYERQNINEMNRFLSEYVAMWYVWKNNMYSDYIGFCHYRRMIDIPNIRFDKLKDSIQSFFQFEITKKYEPSLIAGDFSFIKRLGYSFPTFMVDDCIEYINTQIYVSKDDIKSYCNEPFETFIYYAKEIYCCSWKTFCDLMAFINGYVEFIKKKYDIYSYDTWVKHIHEKIIPYYKSIDLSTIEDNTMKSIYQKREDFARIYDDDEGLNSFCNIWRAYSYFIEDLISIYIGTHNNVK